MLSYSEVLPKTLISLDGQPYEVLSAHVFRMQMRKPVNKTKLRNLKTGAVVEYTFHQPDKIEEAEVESKQAIFIYNKNNEWWFHEANNKPKRFSLDNKHVGSAARFLAPNTEVPTLWFENQPIQVRIPIKMDLRVNEAPPDVRGNTAQGGSKIVTLETGATLSVPMFVKEGDVVRVNTETGTYVERA